MQFELKYGVEDGVLKNKNGLWTYEEHQGLACPLLVF
jgi:hypothetical protein